MSHWAVRSALETTVINLTGHKSRLMSAQITVSGPDHAEQVYACACVYLIRHNRTLLFVDNSLHTKQGITVVIKCDDIILSLIYVTLRAHQKLNYIIMHKTEMKFTFLLIWTISERNNKIKLCKRSCDLRLVTKIPARWISSVFYSSETINWLRSTNKINHYHNIFK